MFYNQELQTSGLYAVADAKKEVVLTQSKILLSYHYKFLSPQTDPQTGGSSFVAYHTTTHKTSNQHSKWLLHKHSINLFWF